MAKILREYSGGFLKENNIHSSGITGRRPQRVHLVKNLSKSLTAFQGIVRLLVLGALIPEQEREIETAR